jgi:hypothetical protein
MRCREGGVQIEVLFTRGITRHALSSVANLIACFGSVTEVPVVQMTSLHVSGCGFAGAVGPGWLKV